MAYSEVVNQLRSCRGQSQGVRRDECVAARAVSGASLASAVRLCGRACQDQSHSAAATGEFITRNVVQFKEEVEGKTGGAVLFEIFDSARLYKDPETLAAVAAGAVEMAVLPLAQFNEKVPALGVIEQWTVRERCNIRRTEGIGASGKE